MFVSGSQQKMLGNFEKKHSEIEKKRQWQRELFRENKERFDKQSKKVSSKMGLISIQNK